MALLKKEFDELDVDFGKEPDVCLYCVKDLLKNVESENNNIVYAEKELRGKLVCQRIYRNKRRNLVICADHLKQIVKKVCPGEVES